MIGISKLYCGTVEASDVLRYGRKAGKLPSHLLQFSEDKKPVVVWNMTRACNLTCLHCYAKATKGPAEDELTIEEAKKFIKQVSEFGAPVMLFSGGEPLMHPHIFSLITEAKNNGLRAVLSTNGLLINEKTAVKLKEIGLSYVGVSLDGLAKTHDEFRCQQGAFVETLKAIRISQKAGLKVGLRLTLSKRNLADLPQIFNLIEEENIPRACFYHLVNTGRGENLSQDNLSHQETRKAVDYIIDRTKQAHDKGNKLEILTVDNHSDGPYIYLRMKRENNPQAEEVLKLLKMNGGNSSGNGIAAVSWNGEVHPDQFWRDIVLGSVKEKTFGEIWLNKNNKLLQQLKNKTKYVTGRCQKCKFLNCCGGNLRARAVAHGGATWAVDPACYLTDEEIGI